MIHTPESLRRAALRTGSVVEIDGKPFNAGRNIAPYVPVPPAPAPTEAPKPIDRMPEVVALMAIVAKSVEASSEAIQGIQQALQKLKSQAPVMQQGTKPKKWVWDFIRDPKSRLLLRIEATLE